jgi:hypothetical protein
MERVVRLTRKNKAYVLPTESSAQFEEDVNGVAKAIKPQNRIEQIYSDDFACSNWEAQRYRRASSSIVRMAIPDVLYDTLTRQLNAREPTQALLLVEQWCRGDQAARAEVTGILKRHGLEEQDLEAEALRRRLPDLMMTSQLTASAIARRDKALAGAGFFREMAARQPKEAKENDPNGEVVRLIGTRKAG